MGTARINEPCFHARRLNPLEGADISARLSNRVIAAMPIIYLANSLQHW